MKAKDILEILGMVGMMACFIAAMFPAAADYCAMHPWVGEPHHDWNAIALSCVFMFMGAVCGFASVYSTCKNGKIKRNK